MIIDNSYLSFNGDCYFEPRALARSGKNVEFTTDPVDAFPHSNDAKGFLIIGSFAGKPSAVVRDGDSKDVRAGF